MSAWRLTDLWSLGLLSAEQSEHGRLRPAPARPRRSCGDRRCSEGEGPRVTHPRPRGGGDGFGFALHRGPPPGAMVLLLPLRGVVRVSLASRSHPKPSSA
ncbi:hypothetical protein E2562_032530 [Oryza meyeriana var. granulata]|uniref:Uncharacterized protein n=1 Tax=Oryza meyeriana var. granulata TaxID=110450 RepID=A0A6G1DPU2_9ORYZ|nr:hypothetical protein E2562_032530 [Oryza meyeriana var. granulata]